LLLAGLVLRPFDLGFRLALAGGVEAGGAGARCRLERRSRLDLRERVLRAARLQEARVPGVAVELRTQQREAALGQRAGDRACQQRRKRPGAERETQKRKAKARHPVTPCSRPVRASRLIPCSARAEKCVSNQRFPHVSTARGGPPGGAVRSTRALWLMKLKWIW